MQSPQDGQEYIWALASPLRAWTIFIPALRSGIRIISVGMCMYLVNGMTQKNIPREREYAHQVGSMFAWSPRKLWKR